VAEEFFTKNEPSHFLSIINRKNNNEKSPALFDVLLQETAHNNNEFLTALLDIIQLKCEYNVADKKLPFCKIKLADKSLKLLTHIVVKNFDHDQYQKCPHMRLFKCLELDDEQCMSLFGLVYEYNYEKLAVFVFDNCLCYQERVRLKGLVRRYFRDLCERRWEAFLMSLLDNCRLARESDEVIGNANNDVTDDRTEASKTFLATYFSDSNEAEKPSVLKQLLGVVGKFFNRQIRDGWNENNKEKRPQPPAQWKTRYDFSYLDIYADENSIVRFYFFSLQRFFKIQVFCPQA
jgi:hypothetical protein